VTREKGTPTFALSSRNHHPDVWKLSGIFGRQHGAEENTTRNEET
jgi:hypothetical protein